jgi:ACS family hexuronate transporter-like MFS transporter
MVFAAHLHAGLDPRVLRDSFVRCVAFITLATACHQAWSANLFTNATDMFPQKVAGSVVGLGATAGGIGGMFMTLLAGLAVQWTGNQQIVFVWAGVMHLLALALFWFWFKGASCRSTSTPARRSSRTHRRPASPAPSSLAAWRLLGCVVSELGLHGEPSSSHGRRCRRVVAARVLVIGALFYAGAPKRGSCGSKPRAGASAPALRAPRIARALSRRPRRARARFPRPR